MELLHIFGMVNYITGKDQALIPEGIERKGEYYLYGIPMSKEEHKEAISQQSGLPWYKKPAPKG